MAAALADTTGKTDRGRDSDWDRGVRSCAPGKRKVRPGGTPALGDRACCRLRSRLILQPLLCMDEPSLAVCLTVCLGSKSPHRTGGVIYLWQQQPSSERVAIAAAPEALAGGGSRWPLLCIPPPLIQKQGPWKRGWSSQSALDRNRRRTNCWANASQVQIAKGQALYQS